MEVEELLDQVEVLAILSGEADFGAGRVELEDVGCVRGSVLLRSLSKILLLP